MGNWLLKQRGVWQYNKKCTKDTRQKGDTFIIKKSKIRQVVPDEIGLVQSAVFAISMFYTMVQVLSQYIK